MKSRVCFPSFLIPSQPGHGPKQCQPVAKAIDLAAIKGRARWQRSLLRGISLMLIFCWAIGSIWLIRARQGERSTAEVMERRGTIAAHFSAERMRNR